MTSQISQTPDWPDVVREVLRSPGQLIDPILRGRLESRFGCDLHEVRLHCGDRAAATARFFNARAFTTGSHIVFGDEQFHPGTPQGRWLLAHELVHILQQRRGQRVRPAAPCANYLLEQQADQAADLIAADQSLPDAYAISPVPSGSIQCHKDVPCPGTAISAAEQSVYLPANQAIEGAYLADRLNAGHANAILFGSEFVTGRDIQLPSGAANRKFGNSLLAGLRGLRNQLRPDIIDFHSRVFYEIKTPRYIAGGQEQLRQYYRVAELLLADNHTEPPWRIEYAAWYPPHVLALGGDPAGNRIVCTQATDHNRWPALLLYDVRELDDEEKKKRRMRHAVRYQVSDFDLAFDEYWPAMKGELPRSLRLYDPDNPEYVIIVPEEFYRARYQQWNERTLDHYRLKPSYDFPGGHALESMKDKIFIATLILGGVAAVVIVLAASTVAGFAIAGAGAAGAAGTGTAAGGEVISLAAYRAALAAAPQVKTLAAAAGVLLVLGTVKDARADAPSISKVSAIRAVAVADFRRMANTQSAFSTPQYSKFDAIGSCSAGFTKDFAIGGRVTFDGQPHYIVGQISAR